MRRLVLAGAAHGALLARVGVQCGRWFHGARPALRVLVSAAAAWVGGYLSTLPIVASLDHTWFPLHTPGWWEPFATFGLAAGIVCGWLIFAPGTAPFLAIVVQGASWGSAAA